jgi:hypothetical protein
MIIHQHWPVSTLGVELLESQEELQSGTDAARPYRHLHQIDQILAWEA